MNALFWIFFAIPSALIAIGLLVIYKKAYRHPWGCFYVAFALEIFVAALVAAIHSLTGAAPSLVAFFQNWISDSAGWTIVNFHELTNPAISRIFGCGETSVVYAVSLIVLQMVLVAFIIGARWYKAKNVLDPIAMAVLILVVINSSF